MKNLEDLQKIERYLEGDMTENEMADLEVRCLLDEPFRREFQMMEVLVAGIKNAAQDSSQAEKIARLQGKAGMISRLDRRGTNPQRRVILYAAAATVLILIGVSFFIMRPGALSPEEIFYANFEISPNLGLRSARSGGEELLMGDAYRAYEAGDYTRATEIFERHIADSERRPVDLFHMGNCYLVLEEWEKAVTALEEVVQADDRLVEDARWYLALAYLRIGMTNEANQLFDEVDKSLERAERARKISRQLAN